MSFHCILAQNRTQDFVQAYENYQAARPSQQLNVIFNQEKYAPGDTVFFKTYLLSADLGLWSGAQMVEVNLVDRSGKIREKVTLKTEDGIGANQLILPVNLEAGFYNFTAFTTWMRNFGVESMYQKAVKIVTDKELRRKDNGIQFGIEGDNLIAGLQAHVVFYTMNNESTTYLKDGNGMLIDSIRTDSSGFGEFRFIPSFGIEYSIEVGDQVVKLPKAVETGHNLTVTLPKSTSEDVRILVSAPPNMAQSGNLTFIITSKGQVVYQEAIPSNLPRVGKSISQDRLTPGLYEVSLLNEGGSLISFREFYLSNQKDEEIVSRLEVPKQISSRGEIDLSLNIEDINGNPLQGEFSISLVNAKVQQLNTLSFEEEVILGNRIPELTISADSEQLLDNALIISPNRVNWNEILSFDGSPARFGYSTLFQMNGIARDSSGQVLPMNSTLMFHLQRDLMRYEVNVGPQGFFQLNLLDIYGEDELFIMAETPKGTEILDVKVEWIDLPMPEFSKAPDFTFGDAQDSYAEFAAKRKKVDHSFNFFSTQANLDSLADLNRKAAPNVPILEVDNSFNVDDFYLFPTLAEFLNEVVRPLRVGQQRDKPVVRVKFLEPNIATADPLYIIDGIATKNTEFFLSLDPKALKTIAVIKYPRKLSRFGQMAKNGIVIVNSKTGNLREPLNQANLINGLSEALAFKALSAEWAQGSENPKFRSTVYWNSFLKTNENGQFNLRLFNSDDVSPLTLKIQGFAGGKPFTLMRTIHHKELNPE